MEQYLNISNSVKLYSNLRVPDTPMVAIVIVVHGIGEHGGCYDEWANHFLSHSIGVYTYDQRGNGRSTGIRGHSSLKKLKSDLSIIAGILQIKYVRIPIILYGHSMGGQVALSYAFDKDACIHGVIASSPWIKLSYPPPKFLFYIGKLASFIAPWLRISTRVRSKQLVSENSKIESTADDPLLHKKISIKLFADLYSNGEKLFRCKYYPKFPVLLMHGTSDALISFEACNIFAKKNKKYIDFKKWRNMRHNLLKDDGNEAVIEFTLNWLFKNVIKKWKYLEP